MDLQHIVEINSEMNKFKKGLDEMATDKKGKATNIVKYADSMQGKWTPEFIKTYKTDETNKVVNSYQSSYDSLRKHATEVTGYHFEQIRSELGDYFGADVSDSVYRAISLYSLSCKNPSVAELGILVNKAKNYADMRFIKAVAERSIDVENEQNKRKDANHYVLGDKQRTPESLPQQDIPSALKIDRVIPTVPDIDEIYKALDETEQAVNFALTDYFGGDVDLFRLTGSKHDVYFSIASDSLWKNDTIGNFKRTIEKCNGLLTSEKTKLTDKEKGYLHALFGDLYSSQLEARVPMICEYNESVRRLVKLSPTYSKYLTD